MLRLLRAAVITQATTATAAEPMCVGVSFDLRQAVLNVIAGRTLISCGGQVQHILVCEQVADWRSHGVKGYASTASRATWAWVGMGRYPIVALAEARDKALENARAVAQGSDPRDRWRVPTFKQAAERVIRLYKPRWRTEGGSSSERVWRSTRERFVYPEIGDMPISAIFSGAGSGRSLVEREPVTALAKPSILGVLALLVAVAVHANDTELVCSLTSQQASGIVAGVLYCGQEGGDSPLLLMCTSGSRTAMLRGGEAAGAEAEVALTLPDAEPLIAMWEVRDRLLSVRCGRAG